jgi:hypothetical protein
LEILKGRAFERRSQENIKMDLKETGCAVVDWIHISGYRSLAGSCEHGNEPLAGSCEHGNEPLESIKVQEYLDSLSDCKSLNKDFAPWS